MNGGTFEVDVLKVPHHGSENNIDSDFVEAVIARDYVFCGNGSHGNPNIKVIEMMFRRRLAASQKPFRFWFNSSKAVSAKPKHMAEIETLVKKLAKTGKGQFTFGFLTKGSTIKNPVTPGNTDASAGTPCLRRLHVGDRFVIAQRLQRGALCLGVGRIG